MYKLPATLPTSHVAATATTILTADVNDGGYDFSLGGVGFRFAIDDQHSLKRYSEPTTTSRFDNSNEPGEQTLSPLPWVKSQSSFHGGAGLLNAEQPLSQFQYQEAQVSHLRFQQSYGIDCWTPGVVKRLPDCTFSNWSITPTAMAVSSVGGVDYAIVGGPGCFTQLAWNAGPDSAPTVTTINSGGTIWGTGGQANIKSIDVTTDGQNYYALVNLTAANGSGYLAMVVSGAVTSTSAPTVLVHSASNLVGAVGFVKSRLMLGAANKAYEIPPTTSSDITALTPNYTHPVTSWTWTAVSESPSAILMAGQNGLYSAILSLDLSSAGATPTLTGGANVATLPSGQYVTAMTAYAGSFLAIGTNVGVLTGTFDTYSGALTLGPVSLSTTAPVYAVGSRSRFIYAGYTNQQADGSTGLARIDYSQPIDQAGRLAWAPDLRPPTTATTRVGTVYAVDTLPLSQRIIFITAGGVHVEGNAPGVDGDAWLETSRIRYDTATPKLFKLGRVHGTLDTAQISITGSTPFTSDVNLGTFGPISNADPGQFRLPAGANEWVSLRFYLLGTSCVLSSYEVSAYPMPKKQRIIEVPALLYNKESDRWGRDAQMSAADRLNMLEAAEQSGQELRYVEYRLSGPKAALVIIDQLQFEQTNPPAATDDVGGIVTLKLRLTES